MSPPDATSLPSEIDRLFAARALAPAAVAGGLRTVTGDPMVAISENFAHALRRVVHAEKPGRWSHVLGQTGSAHGRKLAAALEREFVALGQPPLGEQPLETCVLLIERHFATQGWGILRLDLSDAGSYGFVVARLSHSYFVAALPDAEQFTDALPSGLLQGFFEHVSGQQLACIEVGCARRGPPAGAGGPHCTFVIAAPELLAPIRPLIGQQPADTILARLRV
ncbi:MAG: hypothetical protein HZA93_18765 [Verrucomicrobia bacterium]|nr:hypothetical protein [Verrucomicrobiota bacterium]